MQSWRAFFFLCSACLMPKIISSARFKMFLFSLIYKVFKAILSLTAAIRFSIVGTTKQMQRCNNCFAIVESLEIQHFHVAK
jgi:hypothetical protein